MNAMIRVPSRPRRAIRGLAALALLTVAWGAHATDVRHWNREPIDVKLPVGHERIVVFGHKVRVGLPNPIANPDVLRVQSTGGAVYLKAKKAFEPQRVQVQNLATGQIMLFDLSGVKHGSTEKLKIVNDANADDSASGGSDDGVTSADHKPAPAEAFEQGPSSAGRAPLPVQLVRHAAQALYAPQRLVRHAPGIHRIAVPHRGLSGLLPAYPVRVKPLAAWRAGPYTVTAIEIVNRDPDRRFALDPRNLAGDFYAASFMHDTIGPAGTLADTTTLFAVTKNGGLSEALTPPAGDRATEAGDAD